MINVDPITEERKPVLIVPYLTHWPTTFQRLQGELVVVLQGLPVKIEHIGSTAVPGLAAKPVIDLLVGVEKLVHIQSYIPQIEALGYEYRPQYEAQVPERRYFVRDISGGMRVHVHIVELGARLWREHLAFRDRLRTDLGFRSEYEALKCRLAAKHAGDKARYSLEKGTFVQSFMEIVE